MKIEELIEAFEKAIPTYQQAVDENWDYTTLRMNWMHGGICLFCKEILEIDIYDTIETYYKNYPICCCGRSSSATQLLDRRDRSG